MCPRIDWIQFNGTLKQWEVDALGTVKNDFDVSGLTGGAGSMKLTAPTTNPAPQRIGVIRPKRSLASFSGDA